MFRFFLEIRVEETIFGGKNMEIQGSTLLKGLKFQHPRRKRAKFYLE